jgi:peptidoglycan/xylan/chitin deacetylase (PgdA/CDA1 family)
MSVRVSFTMHALILTYHAVEPGASPLCVSPELLAEHLDCVAEAGVRTVTVSELASMLRARRPIERTVALTFDDGFASVVEKAAPLLRERGMTATVFCVAGHLGRRSDWASARPAHLESRLADAAALRGLDEAGIEIGSHGMAHAPLTTQAEATLCRELIDAKQVLEAAVGATVTSYAYPYGAAPSPVARRLVETTYAAACTTRLDLVRPGADVYALPRVDAHYVRRPAFLRRVVDGAFTPYLRARSAGARVRRLIRPDYARTT